MPLFKSDLDNMSAGCCTEGENSGLLYIHGRCHLEGKIEVSYLKGSGILRIGCMECGTDIVNIEVAENKG